MGKRLRAPEGQDPSGHVTALEVNSVPRAGSLGVAIMQLEGKLDRLGQQAGPCLSVTQQVAQPSRRTHSILVPQVLDMERSRLNSEMRREMDAEAMKLKNKLTGEVWPMTARSYPFAAFHPPGFPLPGPCQSCLPPSLAAQALALQVKKLSKKRELEEEEVEGFKHRRDSELRRLAQQLAEERCRTVEECANATAAKLEKAVSGALRQLNGRRPCSIPGACCGQAGPCF